jgi:hypothetical protein
MKPYHEHPLLRNYSGPIGPTFFRADWYCQHCGAAIEGPPYEIGEYVITKRWEARRLRGDGSRNGFVWLVYMRSQADKTDRVPLFESTRKREALAHARQLEARRRDILRAVQGDQGAIAENYKQVERLKRAEENSES